MVCAMPDKVAVMFDVPQPTNVQELRDFLGLVNYYGSFAVDASKVYSSCFACAVRDRHQHRAESNVLHVLFETGTNIERNPMIPRVSELQLAMKTRSMRQAGIEDAANSAAVSGLVASKYRH